MNAMMFGLTYVYSWLLMGLGVFLAFRVAADLRRGAKRTATAQERAIATSGLIRVALIALVVLASTGVTYAGAYAFYNLMIVG